MTSSTADDTRPDIIVIGAMKAASSTICAYLEDHPAVYMVPGCEPEYFSDDDVYARGLSDYQGHFAPAEAGQKLAEGSNSYTQEAMYPEAAARMAELCPDARLIYMVRHPIERIVSAWIQNRSNLGDVIPASLDAAMEKMPERYIDTSLYWKQLQAYRAHFSDDQIFVGLMEDLKSDEAAFFTRLCAFLDIAPKSAERGHMNPSAGKAVPNKAHALLSAIPGLRAGFRAVVPSGLRKKVQDRFLREKLDTRPEFSDAMLARLKDQIAPDAHALLTHIGRDPDTWRF